MNRAELVSTLELVKPALAATNMIPIFQCFNFMEGSVSAYNDTIAIVGPSEFEWSCGIHGNTLLGLLSNSKSDDLDISLERDTAIIKIGKTVSKLPFQSEDSFIFSSPDDKWDFKIPFTESFANSLSMCLETVSTDETQPKLHGVTIKKDRMFSCNGDTITSVKLKDNIKTQVLLPTPFCSAVLKLWNTLSMTKGSIQFSDEWIFAHLGEWAVYGRVLEITDPIDFEALIKKTIKSNVPVQAVPSNLSEALSRARVLSDPESQKTIATVEKGKLTLLTETHMGEIKDILILKGHQDVTAHINAAHLQRALQYCDQIAIHENCVVLEQTPDVLQLVSNMG